MKHPFWNKEHLKKIHSITDFEGMFLLAMEILSGIPKPIVQVCGPMTTGGLGTLEKNFEVLEKTIDRLVLEGKSVFDQMPFEIPIQKFMESRKETGYAMDILDKFFLPIFESKHIAELYFIHSWESSIGARWEHDQAKRLGIKIVYLPTNFID